MPIGLLDNFEYWRARAEKARVMAHSMQDPTSREIMLGVAWDYDRMAAKAEERSRRTNVRKDMISRLSH